ncbi:MAG: peptidoglycan DD-metalloendopeptidase family protein [Oscillibacter sp.]|nr:peptidoglycan DD-metalloendopeptidase family protein [Oscillibacter sp.]
MKHNRKKRLAQVAIAFLCAVLVVGGDVAPMAEAVTKAEIQALQNDADKLEKQKKELQTQINALKNDRSQALKKKNLIDDQIAATSSRIQNAEAQIATYEIMIQQAEADLADAEEREADQYDLFCRRVRAMEEQGTVNYWAILFHASSFSDLLGRLDIINEIMEADNRIMEDLRTLQAEISQEKADLESSKAESEAVKSDLVSQKKELDDKRAEANQVIREIAESENELHADLEEAKAEEKRIEAEITRLQKKWEEEQRAAGNNISVNPGGYIWPVDSRRITSTVGGRASPGGIGSTNHKGTDIGGVGYTSSIYAAKAGTVLISTKSSSYGNYVVISHGEGNTTLYAHMSSRKVEVGDYVKQGQVIGITGSTGNSTGPHLHFEVKEKNVIVNPLSHGAEPRKGYLSGYTLVG